MKSMVLLILFVLLLISGLFLPSVDYQHQLSAGPESFVRIIELVLLIALTHGWVNALFLAVIAAYLGSLQRTQGPGEENLLMTAVTRGFFVWILLIGGEMYFEAAVPAVEMTQTEYIRLTLTGVVVSFLVGVHPHLFSKLLHRAESMTLGGEQDQ